MAIVEMKRITLLALKSDKEALLHAMQKMGCIQISDIVLDENYENSDGFGELNNIIDSSFEKESLESVTERIGRINWALAQLGRYAKEKAPLFGSKPEIQRESSLEVLEKQDELMQIVAQTEDCERRRGELRGQEARIHVAMEQLVPWLSLDVPAESIHNTKETMQLLGTMPKSEIDNVIAQWQGQPVYIQKLSAERDAVYLYMIIHNAVSEAFLAQVKPLGFVQSSLNDVNGRPADQNGAYLHELKIIAGQYEEINNELKGLSAHSKHLKILFDMLTAQKDRLAAAQHFVQTKSAFLMEGWVPAALSEKIEAGIISISPSASVMIYAPEEGEEPPVLLHNNRVVTPFESVVQGFSLPAPGGLDPTAVMMPFFVNFFGMMVSDAGYGLVMALFIPLVIKFFKPSKGARNLMWMLTIGGIATVLWGALYNTWFGFGPWPTVFDPVNDSLPVMGVCIGLGAVHLFAGLGVGAYMNFKRGKPWDALFDQISWFMVVLGAALLLLPQTAVIGQYMAIAGVLIILFTAGRGKGKNPFKRLIGGLGALYGVTSWVSDLLSYMRLFGMGLATGVIGMVINQLVAMVFGAGPIGIVLGSLLFVGGHIFNAAINILGAYVHSCRLQYIEFFGKFYEDGGKPFVPLAERTRFVNIMDAPAPDVTQ